jgi:hypothetical protein
MSSLPNTYKEESMSTEELEYQLEGVSFSEVEQEIQKIWAQMQQPGSQVTSLVDEKIVEADKLKQLKSRSLDEVMTVDKGSGFAGETALIVAFAPVAATIVKNVWEHFILPRLIARFGPEAITPQKGGK